MASIAEENHQALAGLGGLRFTRAVIKDYMVIEFRELDLHGKSFKVSGPNGSGKTSLLEAFVAGLGLKSKKEAPSPIRKGADKALLHFEIEDENGKRVFTIDREIRADKEALIVKAADGSRFANPQRFLDSFCDRYIFDCTRFITARPLDQIEELLRACGIEPPVAKVKDLTHEYKPAAADESASAYLDRLFGDDRGEFYFRRRDANRSWREKEAALEEVRQNADNLPPLPEASFSVADLLKERQDLDGKRHQYLAAQTEAREAQQQVSVAQNRLKSCESEKAQMDKRARELERQLAEVKQLSLDLADRSAKGTRIVAELCTQAEADEAAAAALANPAPLIVALDERIRAAEGATEERVRREQAQHEINRLAVEAADAKEAHASLDMIVNRGRDMRAELLDGIDLGVNGLEVGDGELILNGVPFAQGSMAEKILVSFAVGIRRNPAFKFFRCDECERFDKDSFEVLRSLAQKYGWQAGYAFVRDVEDLQFEIVEAR